MRHLKSGWKLKRTSSHRKALLRNLATELLEHKRIETTVVKAKALRPFVEKLITKAKRALLRERQNLLPAGHKVDIHTRRIVGRFVSNKAVLQELFDTIAPVIVERPGGYVRIVKTGFRRGDASEMAVVELVDWGAPQDGAVSKRAKAKAKPRQKARTQSKSKKTTKKIEKETQTESEIPTIEEVVEPVATVVADVEKTTESETVEHIETPSQSTTEIAEKASDVSPMDIHSENSLSESETDEKSQEKQ